MIKKMAKVADAYFDPDSQYSSPWLSTQRDTVAPMLGRDTGYGDAELLPRLSDCFRWREWGIREPEHLITRDSIYASLFLSLYFSLVANLLCGRHQDASPGGCVGARGSGHGVEG